MKRRSPFALRRLPLALSLLGTPLLGCEIEIARSSPNSSVEPLDDFRDPYGDGLEPTPPRPSGPSTEEPNPEAEPWLQYRDLIAIDPYLVQGSLASNARRGAPLSFRSQMEWLADSTRDPLLFVRSWFEQWTTASDAESDLPPVAARPRARPLLIDSWLGVSAVGGADAGADAGYVPRFVPSWADAPFVLIAIVNRVDLASDSCTGFAGELRYIYAALDVESREPLDMTIIVEIPYPTRPGAAAWARAWGDIAGMPPGELHADAVEALARDIQAEADPLRARVRTNEVALGDGTAAIWEMREFRARIIGSELALAQVPLESTPRANADPAALAAHVVEHSEEILSGPVPLPSELQAGAAEIPGPEFSWPVLGVSERLRRAFSVETCNGCHGGDTETLPFRHVAPGRTPGSRARLSRFLYDPEAPNDELRRRSQVIALLASTQCEPPAPESPYATP